MEQYEHDNKIDVEQSDQEVAGKMRVSDRDDIGPQQSQSRNRDAIPWMTYMLFGVNTGAFVLETMLGFFHHFYSTVWDWIWISTDAQAPLLKYMGALAPTVVWENWRLLTFFFLHAGLLHYILNMWALLSYRQTERLYGKVGYLVIYLLGGLASGLGAMLTFLLFPHLPFVVGASGAIYAIATADLMESMVKYHPSRRGWLFAVSLWVLPMFIGNPFAHISGAIIGALIGWYLLRRASLKGRRG